MTPPPHAAPARTRDDLIALGRASRPWEFLPAATLALTIAPGDPGLRFLAAANLARLGLRTLAREILDSLSEAVSHHPDIRALSAALSGLPDDRVSLTRRRRTLEQNLAALRSPDLAEHLPRWHQHAATTLVYRCLEGNVVRRDADAPRADLASFGAWRDDRGRAAESVRSIIETDAHRAGIVVEGIDPPWTLFDLHAATNATPQPRITLVQSDILEFLDGLALADLRGVLADPRVEVFVGSDASEHVARALRDRPNAAPPARVLLSPGLRTRLDPTPSQVIGDTHHAPISLAGPSRSLAYWHGRYAAIGPASPGRVLIPSTLHSTFTRHAADDLADAFTRLGWQATILREPDAFSVLADAALANAVTTTDPDLIVSINTPRAALHGACPEDIPFVTWIQDARPDLLDGSANPLATDLDFAIGHLFPELLDPDGTLPLRAMPAGVPASPTKFHNGPLDPATRARFECDLLYVSHHSEAPEQLHARLIHEACDDRLRRVFTLLERDVRAIVAQSHRVSPPIALRDAAEARVREVIGHAAPAHTLSLVLHLYAAPLAERLIRHEMLEWAASLARRDNLRFHIHGQGWEHHPILREFARGPLDHSDDLRSAYHAARVTLHASVHTLSHQRTIECALSGGFTACRFQFDALAAPAVAALASLLAREPDARDGDRVGYALASHPQAADPTLAHAEFGTTRTATHLWISNARATLADAARRPADQNAAAVLGDFNDFTFTDAAKLGALVGRAINDTPWRATTAARQRAGALELATHDALADRLLHLVRQGLTLR